MFERFQPNGGAGENLARNAEGLQQSRIAELREPPGNGADLVSASSIRIWRTQQDVGVRIVPIYSFDSAAQIDHRLNVILGLN